MNKVQLLCFEDPTHKKGNVIYYKTQLNSKIRSDVTDMHLSGSRFGLSTNKFGCFNSVLKSMDACWVQTQYYVFDCISF